MRKLFIFACVVGLILSGASPLFAGGADNKTNWSAEYIRTLNRNAATDSADIVMYNPAGVMKMEDGVYGNVSAHYIAKDYNNRIDGVDFDQDEPSVVPGIFAVYKTDRWAGYFGLSNVLGGGEVEYNNGNLTTLQIGSRIKNNFNGILTSNGVPSYLQYAQVADMNFKGEQTGLGYTFGGAYKINDMFSMSLAARYLDTEIEMKGGATITPDTGYSVPGVNDPVNARAKFEEDADGWGALIGLNISPNDQWNIGIRYETEIDLDFDQTVKYDQISGNTVPGGVINNAILPAFGRTDGGERTRNLPAIFAGGVSYQVNPKIRIETNLTYYFNQDADFPDIPGTDRDESDVDDGFDVGIALEYTFSETLKGSIGYLYTETGVDAKNMTPWLPELDAQTLGAGVAWEVKPDLVLNFAVGQVFYEDDNFVWTSTDLFGTTTGYNVKYEKDITFLGFGVQYKFR